MASIEYYKGLSSVFGGVMIHLTLGTFYTLGNVNTYMTSYLKHYVEPDAEYANSIWVNAAFMLGQGTLMMFGGVLERKIGARWTCLLGSVIFSGSIALTYYSVQRGFIWIVLTYGFMSSMGAGIAYVAPLAAGMKRKGLVNGITVGGFGLGALVFNYVQTAYLNPSNIAPNSNGFFTDEAILNRVPSLFVMLGCVYMTIQVIACVLIFRPPYYPDEIIFNEGKFLLIKSPVQESVPLEYNSCDEGSSSPQPNVNEMSDLEPMEALRTNEFIQMSIMFALSTQSVQFINTLYKAFGQEFIHDDHFLVLVGSIASVFNSGGRIVWGYLLDKSSFKTCFISLCTILSVLMLTFIMVNNKTLYFIWVLSIFFTFSGLFVIFPTATAQVFGKSHAGTIYGMLFASPAVTSLFGALLFQIVQKELGWFGSFCVVALLTIMSLILMIFFPSDVETLRHKRKQKIRET